MTRYELEGITKEEEVFRPSVWAEMLIIGLDLEGSTVLIKQKVKTKSIVFYDILEKTNPNLYNRLLDFATINNLKIVTTGS